MTIRRRLLIEFGVSFVLGLTACLGVSAYLAGTSDATRVAAATDTKIDPIVHMVAYSGMGFSVAMAEPVERDDELRKQGVHVRDRKDAGAGIEWAMDALRDRSVSMAGAYGWPVLFCRWTYAATPAEAAGVRGSHAWGPVRRFDIELPAPPGGSGAGAAAMAFANPWASQSPPRVTLHAVPSYMLPTSLTAIDVVSLLVSASVFIVACWIVLHLLIELVRLVLGLGAPRSE